MALDGGYLDAYTWIVHDVFAIALLRCEEQGRDPRAGWRSSD
jgi:hypothetical protein